VRESSTGRKEIAEAGGGRGGDNAGEFEDLESAVNYRLFIWTKSGGRFILAETLLSAGIGNPYTQRFHNETTICARGRIICRLINDFIWRRSARAMINIRVAEIMLGIDFYRIAASIRDRHPQDSKWDAALQIIR